MPLDNTGEVQPLANVLDRLRRLRDIANRPDGHGYQGYVESCLMHEVKMDTVFSSMCAVSDLRRFFDLDFDQFEYIFGSAAIENKARYLNELVLERESQT